MCGPQISPSSLRGNFKVLLIQRASKGSFASQYVFPGGMLETADDFSNPEWKYVFHNHNFNENFQPKIAAIRETLEEVGIAILEKNSGGSLEAYEIAEIRRQLLSKVHGPGSFARLCAEYKISPSIFKLTRFSHWITPENEKKRYDAQFYLTCVSQTDLNYQSVDGNEAVRMHWYTPKEVLDSFERGGIYILELTLIKILSTPFLEIGLYPPQFCILTQLSEITFDELSFEHLSMRTVQTILPKIRVDKVKGSVVRGKLILPGDEDYDGANQKGWLNRLSYESEGNKFRTLVWLRKSLSASL
ncbi:hypothetical protein HK096_003788 [Nowakowskiella sp. JEL0078]|nr:hypothetical protein HK096_003788 [Nowakowskiella sp. JEL0078]